MIISELRVATDQVLQKFTQVMSLEEMTVPSHTADDLLRNFISNFPEGSQRLEEEFWTHGPLTEILDDMKITEIIVNGPRQIWYERDGMWLRHDDEFLSNVTFKNWIHRLCTESGITLDLNRAFGNGRWREFRIHVACAPLVHCDFHVSLRRHSSTPWSLERLHELKWADADSIAKLKALIEAKSNLIFVGPTGCGKTSVLSACLNALPQSERVVIIEDTDELNLPNACSTKLLVREDAQGSLQNFDLTSLVKQSLRMRPQRLTIGEVRGGEAKDLMLALATGHKGSFGTLHAEDARQALLRLEMLVQIGAPQWSSQTIRHLISLSVNHIVVCGFQQVASLRDSTNINQRRLLGLFKLASLETCGFLLEHV